MGRETPLTRVGNPNERFHTTAAPELPVFVTLAWACAPAGYGGSDRAARRYLVSGVSYAN